MGAYPQRNSSTGLQGFSTIGTEETLNVLPAPSIHLDADVDAMSSGEETSSRPVPEAVAAMVKKPAYEGEGLMAGDSSSDGLSQAEEGPCSSNARGSLGVPSEGIDFQALESKLKLITLQRNVSAAKCEIFLDYLEEHSRQLKSSRPPSNSGTPLVAEASPRQARGSLDCLRSSRDVPTGDLPQSPRLNRTSRNSSSRRRESPQVEHLRGTDGTPQDFPGSPRSNRIPRNPSNRRRESPQMGFLGGGDDRRHSLPLGDPFDSRRQAPGVPNQSLFPSASMSAKPPTGGDRFPKSSSTKKDSSGSDLDGMNQTRRRNSFALDLISPGSSPSQRYSIEADRNAGVYYGSASAQLEPRTDIFQENYTYTPSRRKMRGSMSRIRKQQLQSAVPTLLPADHDADVSMDGCCITSQANGTFHHTGSLSVDVTVNVTSSPSPGASGEDAQPTTFRIRCEPQIFYPGQVVPPFPPPGS